MSFKKDDIYIAINKCLKPVKEDIGKIDAHIKAIMEQLNEIEAKVKTLKEQLTNIEDAVKQKSKVWQDGNSEIVQNLF